MRSIIKPICLFLLGSLPVQASWNLDSEISRLTFISIKATHIAELHSFEEITGNIDDQGNISIIIKLDSVDTGIEIRDNRMRSLLFKTDKYKDAMVSGLVDIDFLDALIVGKTIEQELEFVLLLNGQEQSLSAPMMITLVEESVLLVTSVSPILINAMQFALADGVEALREVAGLPNISLSVPVNFFLKFDFLDNAH
tara:strand:- start:787 stop:1377 length:591 start_codon:yes stop_codon:yes gene_type:complete